MKHCSKCNSNKPFSEFYTSKATYLRWCKPCRKHYYANRVPKPPPITHKVCKTCNIDKPVEEYIPKRGGRFGSECRPCETNTMETLAAQREVARLQMEEATKERRLKEHRAHTNKYRAGKACPAWSDMGAIKAFYVKCPDGYQVDHIIPLNSDTVSGLHVLSNLQYLTPDENRLKGNTCG